MLEVENLNQDEGWKMGRWENKGGVNKKEADMKSHLRIEACYVCYLMIQVTKHKGTG